MVVIDGEDVGWGWRLSHTGSVIVSLAGVEFRFANADLLQRVREAWERAEIALRSACDSCGRPTDVRHHIDKGGDGADVCGVCFKLASERVA